MKICWIIYLVNSVLESKRVNSVDLHCLHFTKNELRCDTVETLITQSQKDPALRIV
jgi:hypothetical protein